jgi:hypothetical protein
VLRQFPFARVHDAATSQGGMPSGRPLRPQWIDECLRLRERNFTAAFSGIW